MIISASQVKKLREMTGAGMMDCKTALSVTAGQMEEAVNWLRKKGIAKAEKKIGRIATEGLVSILSKDADTTAVIVEVNSETDFVARSAIFQNLVLNITTSALTTDGLLDQVVAAPYPHSNFNVAEAIKAVVSNIGENINLRRVSMLRVNVGVVATYIHNRVIGNLGRIGVIVALETQGDKEKTLLFGRQIAMHIAASNPMVLAVEELPSEVVKREESIFVDQSCQSGLSEKIIEKMVKGRMNKFYEEVVLYSQAFVINPSLSVEDAIKEAEKTVGAPINITGYIRFALGDGKVLAELDTSFNRQQ